MWRALPQQGSALSEVRVEGGVKDRDVVIVPRSGEHLRIRAAGEIAIETLGLVVVRTAPIGDAAVRITFSGEELTLERAEVIFHGTERDWDELWRRARVRSRPWWNEDTGEIELDWDLEVRLVVAAVDRRRAG